MFTVTMESDKERNDSMDNFYFIGYRIDILDPTVNMWSDEMTKFLRRADIDTLPGGKWLAWESVSKNVGVSFLAMDLTKKVLVERLRDIIETKLNACFPANFDPEDFQFEVSYGDVRADGTFWPRPNTRLGKFEVATGEEA